MALTRGTTGNAKPRVFTTIDTAPVTVRAKKTSKKPAAASKVSTGRVTKKPAAAKKTGTTKKTPAAAPKKKVSVVEKAKGVLLKAEGAITGKPAKKGTAKVRGTDGKKKTTAVKA